MQDLTITLIQANLHWEQAEANREKFGQLIAQSRNAADVIILPEMFTTGFSMNTLQAEEAEANNLRWMQEQAAQTQAVVTGSIMTRMNEHVYNRLFWVRPDGTYDTYDKRHLFRMAGEHEHYAAGQNRLITEWKGWKICPLICYDLRFPVWSRNRSLNCSNDASAYDLLLYVANWPERRSFAWKSLLVARAIENQVYVVGVNRVGTDGNDVKYAGDSVALDPHGKQLTAIEAYQESVTTVTLSANELEQYREQFPVGKDADDLQLCLDPSGVIS